MNSNDDAENVSPIEPRSGAAKRAQDALGAARDLVAGADLDQLRKKAADAAAAVYHEGRNLVSNSPDLAKAKDELRDSIRQNPLAAIGIAFTAGLLLALLTRG